MEPLWSPVVATGGNRSQIARAGKPPKQAKTVAVGCDRLPSAAHGKEGVNGSSPLEGLSWNDEAATKGGFSVAIKDTADHLHFKEGVNDRQVPPSQYGWLEHSGSRLRRDQHHEGLLFGDRSRGHFLTKRVARDGNGFE
jgi:hypothetical protein